MYFRSIRIRDDKLSTWEDFCNPHPFDVGMFINFPCRIGENRRHNRRKKLIIEFSFLLGHLKGIEVLLFKGFI